MSARPEAPRRARPGVAEGRRELHDVLRAARAVEERRLNPFLVNVAEALETADRYFSAWERIDDLTLDARVLNALSRVVKAQEARLEYQARLFHADPDAVAEKVAAMAPERLARVLLQAWHPIVAQEQLTPDFLEEAMAYWQALAPLAERRRERPRRAPPEPEALSLDDLLARGVLAREGFGSFVAELWEELRKRGPTDYWAFIAAPRHGERVRRAYATSYLVTYGYAGLARRDGGLVLAPRSAREPPGENVSLPLVVA